MTQNLNGAVINLLERKLPKPTSVPCTDKQKCLNSEIVDFDKNCQHQIQSVIRAKEIQKLGSE